MTRKVGIAATANAQNPITGTTTVDELYTTDMAADYLDVSEPTFKNYVAMGRIPGPDGYVRNTPVWHERTIANASVARAADKRYNPDHYRRENAELRRRTEAAEQALRNFERDPLAEYRSMTDDELDDVLEHCRTNDTDPPPELVQVYNERLARQSE